MPVVISSEKSSLWLNPNVTDINDISALLKPYPAEHMIAHRVSARVNDAKLNNAGLIAPIETTDSCAVVTDNNLAAQHEYICNLKIEANMLNTKNNLPKTTFLAHPTAHDFKFCESSRMEKSLRDCFIESALSRPRDKMQTVGSDNTKKAVS